MFNPSPDFGHFIIARQAYDRAARDFKAITKHHPTYADVEAAWYNALEQVHAIKKRMVRRPVKSWVDVAELALVAAYTSESFLGGTTPHLGSASEALVRAVRRMETGERITKRPASRGDVGRHRKRARAAAA